MPIAEFGQVSPAWRRVTLLPGYLPRVQISAMGLERLFVRVENLHIICALKNGRICHVHMADTSSHLV